MAKKKKKKAEEGGGGGSPAWMATFSDLMNLLVCFFVLLFSMSSIDAEKYAQVAASLKSSFSIFESGGAAIGEGQLISSGVSQLNELDSYTYDTGQPVEDEEDPDDESFDKAQFAEEYMEEKDKEAAEEIYEEVAETIEKENIDGVVEIYVDAKYQYVKLSISGAILFDSGQGDIKEESKPILDKIGNILKNYDDHLIKIEGHTDNVPITKSNKYKDNMQLSSARAYSVWQYMTSVKHLSPETLEASGRSEFDPIADNSTADGRSKNRRVEFKIYNESIR